MRLPRTFESRPPSELPADDRHWVTSRFCEAAADALSRTCQPQPRPNPIPTNSHAHMNMPYLPAIRFLTRGPLGAVLILTLLAASGPHLATAQAQSASGGRAEDGTGAVEGRVTNIVTGKYLPNAQVSVRGTDLVTFTDDFGSYRLVNVPAGPIILEVFYTGLDPQQVPLTLSAGQRIEQELSLTNVERYGKVDDAVKMGAFVVTQSRLTEGEALNVNEQRFAPNIKNVVATDAFGDVTGGNVAEFLNFIPGVNTILSEQSGVSNTVGMRGFDATMVGITVNGAAMPNASGSRTIALDTASINNYSRVEVTKVPTPATAADSMGGSINLVSKSAFERSTAEFRYRLYMVANERYLSTSKSAFVREESTRKIVPGFDFDYTLPLTKNFGVVMTGLIAKQFENQGNVRTDFSSSATGAPATPVTPATPMLASVGMGEGPKHSTRRSFAVKADWRITPHSVLSVRGESTEHDSDWGRPTLSINTGTNGSPRIAGRQSLSHGPDFVMGAQGRGTVELGTNDLKLTNSAATGSVAYRFDNVTWRIDAALAYTKSRSGRDTEGDNTFWQLSTTLAQNPNVRVTYEDIGIRNPGVPGTIRAFDNSDQEIDLTDPKNYTLTTAKSVFWRHENERTSTQVNVRRNLDRFAFPLTVQTGVAQLIDHRDARSHSWDYTYNGMNGDRTLTPYVSQTWSNHTNIFGFKAPWPANSLAYAAHLGNPGAFIQTAAQKVTQDRNRINGSWEQEENTQAIYFQAEMKLLRNRLRALGGFRYERTDYDGSGLLYSPEAVWERNADGSFARNQTGQRIRKAAAGAVGSMEELALVRIERGHHVDRSIDGYYPSLHLTYNISKNLLARAAYAKTYGRPNFNNIVPNTTINEFDDITNGLGRITARNISLQPWSADNYDLSLEYYTDRGGVITAGVFRKQVSDFFGDIIKDATAEDLESLGLDPVQYLGYELRTTINAGDATLDGIEVDVRHSLEPLGGWGRHFSVFANWTKVNLKADPKQVAQFSNFRPLTINGGFTFSRKPVTLQVRWQYRGDENKTLRENIAPGAYIYEEARQTVDLNLTYEFHKRLSFFANGSNVFNARQIRTGYGAETPDYARPYRIGDNGAAYTMGIRGTF